MRYLNVNDFAALSAFGRPNYGTAQIPTINPRIPDRVHRNFNEGPGQLRRPIDYRGAKREKLSPRIDP